MNPWDLLVHDDSIGNTIAQTLPDRMATHGHGVYNTGMIVGPKLRRRRIDMHSRPPYALFSWIAHPPSVFVRAVSKSILTVPLVYPRCLPQHPR